MEAMSAPTSSDVAVTQEELPVLSAPALDTPAPFSSFTAPLPLPVPEPIKEEPPLEESLAYEEDVEDSELSPEVKQALLDPSQDKEMEKPQPPTPSEGRYKRGLHVCTQ